MVKKYCLESYKWSSEKFDEMLWHDCKVHAIAFDDVNYRLLLDIDYILKWEGPDEKGSYSFWIAPATLIYNNVYDLSIDLKYGLETILDYIERDNERKPQNIEYINQKEEWDWTLETTNGTISFVSAGYLLYFRSEPVYREKQSFTIDERGGFSFAAEVK